MKAWRRWQDYATMLFGIALFVSPFVFGDTSQTVAAGSAYLMGGLLFLSGLLSAAMREPRGIELIPAVLGVVTFVMPWILGFTGVTAVAWIAWVVGILAVLNSGSVLVASTGRATTGKTTAA
jgi:uncharacterized membrane protein HdeD (DUF308 family)